MTRRNFLAALLASPAVPFVPAKATPLAEIPRLDASTVWRPITYHVQALDAESVRAFFAEHPEWVIREFRRRIKRTDPC